jgi:transposase InsO family protein
MKGATMLAAPQALGVVPSFSRPRVYDDNPYSEALFRTLKYRLYVIVAALAFWKSIAKGVILVLAILLNEKVLAGARRRARVRAAT